MAEFSLPVKVYIEDTDAGGIVYHANYLKYMERSRTEFITHLGYPNPATLEDGLLLVVHSMKIDFLQAATLGEQLDVSTQVVKVARSYVDLQQIVRRADIALCRADVKVACVSKPAMKPAAMPDGLRKVLQTFVE